MQKIPVSIVRYDKPLEPVRQAVELCGGLERIPATAKVFIKPNIVFWTGKVVFPKWGVITTSRLVQDMVRLLKERGVDDLTIGEGMVLGAGKDKNTAQNAFETLGYNKLAQRYGVKVFNAFDRPFDKKDLGDGVELAFNRDALESDYIIDLPVMKTHAQTVVSLGIKNLKGLINVNSRKVCHNADLERDLNFHVARLDQAMPPILTVIDGTYTAEYGPGFDAVVHRSDILAASWDVLAVDMVGAGLLGHDPTEVPYLVHAAKLRGRDLDISGLEIRGEKIENLAKPHNWSFPYNEDDSLPLPLAKKGLQGLAYYKYDNTLCTYCSDANGAVLTALARAWNGQPWDEVEILTGKRMNPRPGANKTILLGKCMYQRHKDNPDIKEMIPIKGCPPKPEQIIKALEQAGIKVDPKYIAEMDTLPGMYMRKYKDRPEFEESHFQIEQA